MAAGISKLIKTSNLTLFIYFLNLQFDSYLRSLKIDHSSVCLVTDGQLPLRQCLHPESCAKDIHLPSYYWKFSDLKKEFVQKQQSSTSGDSSSRALPLADVMKLPNMPASSATISTALADILNGKKKSFSVSLETQFF